MSIEVEHVRKTFGSFVALGDVSLTVPTGQLVALLGPSGSGKTTLLRIIAGLEAPDSGQGSIRFHGQDVSNRPIGDRGVGFVFQHYALFRHMNVFDNVAFGMRVKPRKERPPESAIRARVMELLDLVQLGGLHQRLPNQLSGGQRQRVALARALAVEPKILLLDEPFGALDAKVRKELRTWLRRLHERIHVTGVLVTHDQDEALEVADQVVVMNRGAIEQVGSPDEVFHRPSSEFVMDFLGHVNRFQGQVERGKLRFANIELDVPYMPDDMTDDISNDASDDISGDAPKPDAVSGTGKDHEPARVMIRPHDLELGMDPVMPGSFTATVQRIHSAGPSARVELTSATGEEFIAHVALERLRELDITPQCTVTVTPRNVRVFVSSGRSVLVHGGRNVFVDGGGI